MSTETSIQAYLDSLSSLPGSLLYRDDISWKALPPGEENQLLTANSVGKPAWQHHQDYFPAFMQFDGSTAYYTNLAHTTSGNSRTTVLSWKKPTFTGGAAQVPMMSQGPTNVISMDVQFHPTDFPDVNFRNRVLVECRNTADTRIVRLFSSEGFFDDKPHTLHWAYNATTAAFTFIIDGQPADDTTNPARIAPIPGTLSGGANSDLGFGATDGGVFKTTGLLRYFGYHHVYQPDWTKFQHPNGNPKNIEASISTAWISAPLFWHESAKMDENKGTGGNMTRTGNVILAPASTWS